MIALFFSLERTITGCPRRRLAFAVAAFFAFLLVAFLAIVWIRCVVGVVVQPGALMRSAFCLFYFQLLRSHASHVDGRTAQGTEAPF